MKAKYPNNHFDEVEDIFKSPAPPPAPPPSHSCLSSSLSSARILIFPVVPGSPEAASVPPRQLSHSAAAPAQCPEKEQANDGVFFVKFSDCSSKFYCWEGFSSLEYDKPSKTFFFISTAVMVFSRTLESHLQRTKGKVDAPLKEESRSLRFYI